VNSHIIDDETIFAINIAIVLIWYNRYNSNRYSLAELRLAVRVSAECPLKFQQLF